MISISIIVPVFNVEKYIERCIRSVMNQNFEGAIECILVNDCTPDNSIQIINNLLSAYTGPIIFQILHHNTNLGLSAARNSGIKLAKGDYLFFLDSDDEIVPETISTLAKLAIKYKDVDIVYGNWYVSQIHQFLQNNKGLPEFMNNQHEICRRILKRDLSMTAHNKLIRRNFLVNNNLHFMEGIVHEDTHLNYYIAKYVQSIAISLIPTYVYFINSNGITANISKNRISSILKLTDNIIDDKNFIYPQYKFGYCSRFLFRYYLTCDIYPEFRPMFKHLFYKIHQKCFESNLILLGIFTYLIYAIPFMIFVRINYRLRLRNIIEHIHNFYFRK